MAIINLEAAVEKAMKAYLVESGATPDQAASRTQAKLSAGVAVVKAELAKSRTEPDVPGAFSQLKTWTLANA